MGKEVTKTTAMAVVPKEPEPLDTDGDEGVLVKFIERVTEKDLDKLRETIQAREQQLRGMKKLESVVAAALGKEAPKSHKTKKGKPVESVNDKRRRIATFLSNGPRNGHDIITQVGVQPVQLKEIMSCDYFQESPQGWHLSPAGRRAFC